MRTKASKKKHKRQKLTEICTWNVGTMPDTGRTMEISNKIIKHNFAIASLQEIRLHNALLWQEKQGRSFVGF